MLVTTSIPAQHPVVTLVGSSGQVITPVSGNFNNLELYVQTADVVADTNPGLVSLTGLAFSIAADETVSFIANGFQYGVDTATGVGFGVSGPASPTYARFTTIVATSSVATQMRVSNGFGSIGSAAATSAVAASPGYPFTITGFIVNGANAGTVQLQMRSETATFAVTSERGATLMVRRHVS